MRRVVIVPAVLLAAAALGACGSSSSSKGGGASSNPYGGGSAKKPSATTAATTAGTSTTPVALGAKDFAFSPTTLSVPAGGTVKFTNTGSVEHNFTIDGKGVSKSAEAGKSATVKVDLPAGTYKFHCEYHPTQMKGTLTVG